MTELTIIHGDDIVLSKKYLGKLIDKNTTLILSGKTNSEQEINSAFFSKGLFFDNNFILLEGFINAKKISLLQKLLPDANSPVIIWEPYIISENILKGFPQAKIILFKLKKEIFTWLDSLKPGSYQTTVSTFNKLLTRGEVPEVIWKLLVDRLRLLILIENGSINGIPPWQVDRLRRQLKYFKPHKLAKLYLKSIESEFMLKSGKAVFNLPLQIEFLLSAIDRS